MGGGVGWVECVPQERPKPNLAPQNRVDWVEVRLRSTQPTTYDQSKFPSKGKTKTTSNISAASTTDPLRRVRDHS